MDYAERKIYSGNYTLFDRVMYGGLGHGAIIIPTNFFRIIFTVIFPPIGEILNAIGDYLMDKFPYITWDTIKELFKIKTLNRIVYSLVLTTLFYVPGLVYTLANMTASSSKAKGVYVCDGNGDCKVLDDTDIGDAGTAAPKIIGDEQGSNDVEYKSLLNKSRPGRDIKNFLYKFKA